MTRKIITYLLICVYIGTSLNVSFVHAGEVVVPLMPTAGSMVHLSQTFTPAHLKGIVINSQNPLQFDFLIDKGDGQLLDAQKQEEYQKLIKYFLASLTVADKDQWVNLSPYENNRIIENNFGRTNMGRDLLAQDYLLKQITSSLIYPESGLGKKFWDRVYERLYQKIGGDLSETTAVGRNFNDMNQMATHIETFNKVWIVPDFAEIHENGNTAFIAKSHLKVMLEEDYLATHKNGKLFSSHGNDNVMHQILKDIILPELEREVNEGKNFSQLRQVFSGMILATWFKKSLKESLLGHIYADKAKVKALGEITLGGKNSVEHIYQQYLLAFKRGVYNYIKDTKLPNGTSVPRKYFSGGVSAHSQAMISTVKISHDAMRANFNNPSLDVTKVVLGGINNGDAAMTIDQEAVTKELQAFGKKVNAYLLRNKKPALLEWLMNPDDAKDAEGLEENFAAHWENKYQSMSNDLLGAEFKVFIDTDFFQQPFIGERNDKNITLGLGGFLKSLSLRYGNKQMNVSEMADDFIGNSLWLGRDNRLIAQLIKDDKEKRAQWITAKAWVREVFKRAGVGDAAMTPKEYKEDFRKYLLGLHSMKSEEIERATHLLYLIAIMRYPIFHESDWRLYEYYLNDFIKLLSRENSLRVLESLKAYYTIDKVGIYSLEIEKVINFKLLNRRTHITFVSKEVTEEARFSREESTDVLGFDRIEIKPGQNKIVDMNDIIEQRNGLLIQIDYVFRNNPYTLEIYRRESANLQFSKESDDFDSEYIMVSIFQGIAKGVPILKGTRKGVLPSPYKKLVKGNLLMLRVDSTGRLFEFGNLNIGNQNEREQESIRLMYKPKSKLLTFSSNDAMSSPIDLEQSSKNDVGGIDMNAANMDMIIQREKKGGLFSVEQQSLLTAFQMSHVEGFEPHIIEILPAVNVHSKDILAN